MTEAILAGIMLLQVATLSAVIAIWRQQIEDHNHGNNRSISRRSLRLRDAENVEPFHRGGGSGAAGEGRTDAPWPKDSRRSRGGD